MALLTVLQFPDPRLKLVAKPVETFDQQISKIFTDLIETMYAADGVGLAATQVNIQQRIFVMDLSDNKQQPLCLINPRILQANDTITWEEGCLSFPNIFAKVKRSANIMVEFHDLKGQIQQLEAKELAAVCIQHEIDHLDGITFYDHLSPLKQKMLRKKIEKQYDKTQWLK